MSPAERLRALPAFGPRLATLAFLLLGLPVAVWLDRPWPRRSMAMTRKPWCRKNRNCASQSSALKGQSR